MEASFAVGCQLRDDLSVANSSLCGNGGLKMIICDEIAMNSFYYLHIDVDCHYIPPLVYLHLATDESSTDVIAGKGISNRGSVTSGDFALKYLTGLNAYGPDDPSNGGVGPAANLFGDFIE